MAWAAGSRTSRAPGPVWNHLIPTEKSQAFTKAFVAKYGKPPENQAWGDYMAIQILAQAIRATRAPTPPPSSNISKARMRSST